MCSQVAPAELFSTMLQLSQVIARYHKSFSYFLYVLDIVDSLTMILIFPTHTSFLIND